MVFKTSRNRTVRRVLVHGLPYFGQMLARFLDGDGWRFRFYADTGVGNLLSMTRELKACDIAYQIGGRVTRGRFLRAARMMSKRTIVMHWAGTDTLDERGNVGMGNSDQWIAQDMVHWAECDWMVDEVKALGLPCDRVPLPSCHVPEEPWPMPARFSVLVYVPSTECAQLYGLDRILEVARRLPEIDFQLVGLKKGRIATPPPNLAVHGWIPDLTKFFRTAAVLWRPTRHDGKSFMVMEALGYGRHVIWSYVFPGCSLAKVSSEAETEILRLWRLHQRGQLRLNKTGVDVIANYYEPQALKQQILERFDALLEA